MVVLLSDDEAADVASLLRRMNERVADSSEHTPAYIDNRGPNDFARQIEALVDQGNPSVYVPVGHNGDVGFGYVSRTTAHTAAAKTGRRTIREVALIDPDDGPQEDDADAELPDGGSA